MVIAFIGKTVNVPKSKVDQRIFGARALVERRPGSSRRNANNRLSRVPLLRIEGGDGFVEGGDNADVRPQAPVPHPLDDFAQLGAVGFDDEIDRPAIGGPRLDRSDDGHQGPPGPDQARGPFPDVAADEIEHQIDAADVFQRVILEVDELLRAEVERGLPLGGTSGANDVGACLAGEDALRAAIDYVPTFATPPAAGILEDRMTCAGGAVGQRETPLEQLG